MNTYLGFHYVLIIVMEIAHAQRAQLVNDIKIITIRISLEKRFNFCVAPRLLKNFLAAVETPKPKYQHILTLSC